MIKFQSFLVHIYYVTMINIVMYLLFSDRTKFEREKHKKLVAELKERRTKGESGLIIRNGAIVARPPRPGSNPTNNVTNHPTQSS